MGNRSLDFNLCHPDGCCEHRARILCPEASKCHPPNVQLCSREELRDLGSITPWLWSSKGLWAGRHLHLCMNTEAGKSRVLSCPIMVYCVTYPKDPLQVAHDSYSSSQSLLTHLLSEHLHLNVCFCRSFTGKQHWTKKKKKSLKYIFHALSYSIDFGFLIFSYKEKVF